METNRFLGFVWIIVMGMLLLSCERETIDLEKGKNDQMGMLSFASFVIDYTAETSVVSKAVSRANYAYLVRVKDASGQTVEEWMYGQMPVSIPLPVGTYTLWVQSQREIPIAEFEAPVYGEEVPFTIEADQETSLGQVTCRLVNVKVSVGYNETMKQLLTDDCSVKVEVDGNGKSLDFTRGEARCGYFAVGRTMVVRFSGTVDGTYKTLTKTFTDVKAGQWRKVTFVMTINGEGNATFDVTIQDWCEEKELAQNVSSSETVIGPDPSQGGEEGEAPSLTCDQFDITRPVPVKEGMDFIVNISAPNKIETFYVDVDSDNPDLKTAISAVNGGSSTLDLSSTPPDALKSIFDSALHFPYADQVKGKTFIPFDLGAAVPFLIEIPGLHHFTMRVTDKAGKQAQQTISMQVG